MEDPLLNLSNRKWRLFRRQRKPAYFPCKMAGSLSCQRAISWFPGARSLASSSRFGILQPPLNTWGPGRCPRIRRSRERVACSYRLPALMGCGWSSTANPAEEVHYKAHRDAPFWVRRPGHRGRGQRLGKITETLSGRDAWGGDRLFQVWMNPACSSMPSSEAFRSSVLG
jgi:hypothetical protein